MRARAPGTANARTEVLCFRDCLCCSSSQPVDDFDRLMSKYGSWSEAEHVRVSELALPLEVESKLHEHPLFLKLGHIRTKCSYCEKVDEDLGSCAAVAVAVLTRADMLGQPTNWNGATSACGATDAGISVARGQHFASGVCHGMCSRSPAGKIPSF